MTKSGKEELGEILTQTIKVLYKGYKHFHYHKSPLPFPFLSSLILFCYFIFYFFLWHIYLGIEASAIHWRSILHASRGMCGYGGEAGGGADKSPPVINTSINSCNDVSHRTGSPNNINASILGILGAGSTGCGVYNNILTKIWIEIKTIQTNSGLMFKK